MSITSIISPGPDKMLKISSHWRNNSREIDVFEATQYFSGANDHNPAQNNPAEKIIILENMQHFQKTIIGNNPILINPAMDHQNQTKDSKKNKQSSSPGARLANFLNSLLNQTPLKMRKKSKPDNTKIFDENEENPNGRRKRRNSISHFITSSKTATNSCKEVKDLCDHKQVNKFKPNFQNDVFGENRNRVLQKSPKNGSFGFSSEEREFRKFSDDDDDYADSDSSSDLFDLPNHELDFYSNYLPVYETNRLDRIKIGN